MAQETEDILLNIEVNYSDAISRIGEYRKSINELQLDNKELLTQLQWKQITEKEYYEQLSINNIAISENSANIRVLNKEIQNNLRQEEQQNGSLKALRAELSNTTKEFDELSRAQRQGAEGQQLVQHIQLLRDELIAAEAESGRFQRSVGDYENAILRAASNGNVFTQSLATATAGTGTLGGAVEVLKGRLQSLYTTILRNPILAVLAAVSAVLVTLYNAIKRSETQTNALRAAAQPLQAIMNLLANTISECAEFLIFLVDVAGKTVIAFAKLEDAIFGTKNSYSSLNAEIEKNIELEQERQDLQRLERENTIENARLSRDAAANRAIAADKENKTTAERLAALDLAAKKQQQIADNEYNYALRNYELIKEKNKLTESNTKDVDAEANALAAVYRAQEAQEERRRQNLRERQRVLSEIAQEENKASKSSEKASNNAEKAAKEALRAEKENLQYLERGLSERRKLEDEITSLIDDEVEKRRISINRGYNREIEDLKRALTTRKGITEQETKDINERILVLEKKREKDLLDFTRESVIERSNIIQANLRNRLDIVKNGSREELDIRVKLLDEQRRQEILNAEKTGHDVLLINQKYNNLINKEQIKFEKDTNDRIIDEQKVYYENRIKELEIYNSGEIEIITIQQEQIKNQIELLRQGENESNEVFFERQRALQLESIRLEKQRSESIRLGYEATLTGLSEFFSGASSLLDEWAESNSGLAAFSKALALFEISLNTGKAISAGIAQAQSVPFPANIAAIATTIGAILSNIANATKIVKSSNVPTYSKGGSVFGAGSGTSDSINARLSNTESVNTAKTTQLFSPILSVFNQIGGGLPIQTREIAGVMMGEEFLSQSFARAISNQKAPVLVYEEFKNYQDLIVKLRENARV